MAFLQKLERKFGKYVPENITKVLLIGQVLSYVLVYSHPEFASLFYVSGRQVYQGQVWRLVTILFTPLSAGLFFVLLAWYFFYVLGTALEHEWGSFRYLLYIVLSYAATVLFALLFPEIRLSNVYMYATLFLAFAHVYPNFQVLLFFIIPIKVKWLGYLAWVGLIGSFITGSLPDKVLLLFSVSNYFVFFRNDLLFGLLTTLRGISSRPKNIVFERKPNHICAVCGSNEIEYPNMDIRYCRQCYPETCYCGKHINNHQHKRAIN